MYQFEDLRVENQFESSLAAMGGAQFEHLFSGQQHRAAWSAPTESCLADFRAAFQRDAARAMRPTPADLLRQLRAARREKIANKTHDREREARGEVLSATRRRACLGFPAHVLAR
jgi:hypothetical protein